MKRRLPSFGLNRGSVLFNPSQRNTKRGANSRAEYTLFAHFLKRVFPSDNQAKTKAGNQVMRVAGIDPGATGAVAVFDTDLGTLQIFDAPTALVKVGSRQVSRIMPASFARLIQSHAVDVALLERVHAMPKQGVSSTFAFGHAFGIAEGVLAALAIPYDLIEPQKWQALARVPKGKDGSRTRASQLFPAYAECFARVIDHGRSDAALIAYAFTKLEPQAV